MEQKAMKLLKIKALKILIMGSANMFLVDSFALFKAV